jgi:putative hydrolase of the HAD superfamily
MSDTHTVDEAAALMMELDAGGMRSREDFFREVMRQWPGVFRDVPQAIEVYLSSYPDMLILEPLTRALLEDVQEARIPAAIVTNGGSAMQGRKIDASGLRGLVDAVVISEELGVAKPDPRIFERAMAKIGAVAADSLFVGDNPEADILGAKGVGMRAAWLRRGREWAYDDQRPDYVLDDISEVRELVLADGR